MSKVRAVQQKTAGEITIFSTTSQLTKRQALQSFSNNVTSLKVTQQDDKSITEAHYFKEEISLSNGSNPGTLSRDIWGPHFEDQLTKSTVKDALTLTSPLQIAFFVPIFRTSCLEVGRL